VNTIIIIAKKAEEAFFAHGMNAMVVQQQSHPSEQATSKQTTSREEKGRTKSPKDHPGAHVHYH
jgi:hypothetical protein